MQPIDLTAITTDKLNIPLFSSKGIEADILRLDKIHPLVSGNKWFKLQYYLAEAKSNMQNRIVTFGGAWSNHIIATAAACRLNDLACTGIIRGEKPAVLSGVLEQAAGIGMELVFISREEYSAGTIPDQLNIPENYIIRQGGQGEAGVRGAATILNYAVKKNEYTHICCAVGTGTMLAGLCRAADSAQQLIGISVMKNNVQLDEDVKQMTGTTAAAFTINHDYHFGGYAKHQPLLFSFMNNWYNQTGVPTDFVYTGKLCYAIHDLIEKDFFPEGSRLLLIHSGGLTGNTSLKNGTLIF